MSTFESIYNYQNIMKKKKNNLQMQAIELLRLHPEIDIREFAQILNKKYAHAASLLSVARNHLGLSARESPTKIDKTMALLSLSLEIKGQPFRELLNVSSGRAYELRHTARKRLRAGKQPTPEALTWAENVKSPGLGTSAHKEASAVEEEAKSPIVAKKNAAGNVDVQSVQRQPRDPQDLIRAAGMNPDDWYVASQTVNTWEIGAKHPQTGEILVEPLFQTKVRLEPLGEVQGMVKAVRELIDELKEASPILPNMDYEPKKEGHLLEIAIPDLHLGKYAKASETGEDYNIEIACELFRKALNDLVAQAAKSYPIERIIFPIGNDFLTADTSSNTTTRGTAQDVSGNFENHFRTGIRLLREAVETMRSVAPIEVIIVPGNHDTHAVLAIGELLDAIYENCGEITVHNDHTQPRKYISYGDILLGFAHGHNEKANSLPMLMAVEAADAWGRSRHREIHVGHLHHTRDTHYMATNELDGVLIRVIPSLSASDRWHAAKGYRSQRAALAFVYHPESGQTAIFRHSITNRLETSVPKIEPKSVTIQIQ